MADQGETDIKSIEQETTIWPPKQPQIDFEVVDSSMRETITFFKKIRPKPKEKAEEQNKKINSLEDWWNRRPKDVHMNSNLLMNWALRGRQIMRDMTGLFELYIGIMEKKIGKLNKELDRPARPRQLIERDLKKKREIRNTLSDLLNKFMGCGSDMVQWYWKLLNYYSSALANDIKKWKAEAEVKVKDQKGTEYVTHPEIYLDNLNIDLAYFEEVCNKYQRKTLVMPQKEKPSESQNKS